MHSIDLTIHGSLNDDNKDSHHGTNGGNGRSGSDFTESLLNEGRDQQESANEDGPNRLGKCSWLIKIMDREHNKVDQWL